MTSPKKRKVSDLSDADVSQGDNQHKKRAIARADGSIEKQLSPSSPAVKDEKSVSFSKGLKTNGRVKCMPSQHNPQHG